MKSFRKIIVALILFTAPVTSFSQYIFLGPTYHYNLGGGLKESSFGLEISYWSWEDGSIGFGADIGFEISKNKKRVYSEIQTGMLVGGSFGYVHEFSKDKSVGGIQISGWAAFFGGLEVRFRKIDETNYFAPGAFIKLPLTPIKPKFNFAFGNMFGNLM